MSLQRHLGIAVAVLCGCALVVYLGSEARTGPESLLFAGGVLLGVLLPMKMRSAVPPLLWTSALLGLLATELVRAWFYPADVVVYLFEFVRWLLVAKLWTRASGRDELQVILLAFFVLLGGTVFTFSYRLAFSLFLFVLFAPGALLLASIYAARDKTSLAAADQKLPFRFYFLVLGSGLLVFAGGIAIFFALPRISAAVVRFDFLGEAQARQYPEEMNLGLRGPLEADSRVAFEVVRDGEGSRSPSKWRMMALEDFDGLRWRAHPGNQVPFQQGGRGLFYLGRKKPKQHDMGEHYDFRIAPMRLPALPVPSERGFTPGKAAYEIRGPFSGVTLEDDGQIGFVRPAVGNGALPLEFSLSVFPAESIKIQHEEPLLGDIARLRAVPQSLDPRIRELAEKIGRDAKESSPVAFAAAVEKYLSNSYGYSLDRAPADSGDPLAAFLFQYKAGHCEYFASAATVLLRILGVPARVVTGFAQGEYNEEKNAWVVRESDAHSWSEAYDEGTGSWITVDASPRDLAAEHARYGALTRLFDEWRQQADLWWYNWVIRYSLAEQVGLAGRAFSAIPDFLGRRSSPDGTGQAVTPLRSILQRSLVFVFVLSFLVALWIGLGRSGLRRRNIKTGREYTEMAHFLKPLRQEARRRGIAGAARRTPLELYVQLEKILPDEVSALLWQWILLYNVSRFGGNSRPETIGERLNQNWKPIQRGLDTSWKQNPVKERNTAGLTGVGSSG